MDKDKKMPKMEDYGSPGTDSVRTSIGGDDTVNQDISYEDPERNTQSSGRSGRFGEFEDTGVGTDLTIEMENTGVRNGQYGASDAAGFAQYGGRAGNIRDDPWC